MKCRCTLRMIALAWLLPVASALLLGACGNGRGEMELAASLPAAPQLESVPNFRDLAGADAASVYRTPEGRALRRGAFYRSDVLAPTDADWEVLNGLGITAVYDLRTPGEISRAPDRVPQGADYLQFNLLGREDIDISMFTAGADIQAERFLEQAERSMVSDPEIRSHLARLLTRMAETEGAQLFHCTAGKDRTGWVAALLHAIAGVSQEVMIEDYLLTNTYAKTRIEQTRQQMREQYGEEFAASLAPLMGVQESFLRAGLEQAVESYGSMDNYLRQGLGLDEQVLAALRKKLLE